MTSASNPGNYVDFDKYVGLKLEKTRTTIRSTDVFTALATVAAAFLGYLLVFVILDQWVVPGGFSAGWRWVLLSTLLIGSTVWIVKKIALPSFQTVNGLFAARQIEQAEPELKSNLLNLIDLKAAGRPVSPAVLRAIERQAAMRLQTVDVGQVIDHRPLIRTAYILLTIIVVFCFYAMFSPKKISNSIWRGLLPASQVPLATITEILDVKPGDVTVPAHQQSVEVRVDLAGEVPSQVTLLYSTPDGLQDQPVELHPDPDGQQRYRGQLIGEGVQGLVHDVTYYIRAGDAVSRQYKVTVEQPPYADIETVRLEYPAYMKLPPAEQTGSATIDGWEGAKVIVNAKTNMPVKSAMIQFLDDPQAGPSGEEVAMSISAAGRRAQAVWTLALRSDGTFPKFYQIHCKTDDGRATTGHVLNSLTIRPDMPPEVALLQPNRDLEAAANVTIPMLIQARDPDFELSYLYLNIEKAGQKIVRDQLSEGRKSALTLKHDLALAKLNPAEGDSLVLWIEAYDNKQPRPNSRNTPKITIRIGAPVSSKEAEQQLADQKTEREQKLADSEQQLNRDRTEKPNPRDEDPREREQADEKRDDVAQAEQQQPRDERPQPDQQRDQNQTESADKGGKTAKNQGRQTEDQSKSSDSKTEGDGQQSKSDAAQNSKQNKPLNSDGSQDDEALKKISEKFGQQEKNSAAKPDEQPSESGENKAPSDQSSPSTDGKEPGLQPDTGPADKSAGKNSKDETKQQGESGQKSDDAKADQSPQNGQEKPSKKLAADSQNDSGSQDQGSKKQQTPKADDKKTGDKNPDDKNSDGKNSNDQKSDNQQKSDNKESGQQGDDSDQKTGSDKKSQQGQSGKGQKDEKGDSSASDRSKSSTDKLNGKKADTEQGDGEQGQQPGSDKNEGPDDGKQSDQPGNSSKTKKAKADGSEQGTAQPEKNGDKNQPVSKNDKVQRDPSQKPETVPSQDRPDPSDSKSDQKAEGQKPNRQKSDKAQKPESQKKGEKGQQNDSKDDQQSSSQTDGANSDDQQSDSSKQKQQSDQGGDKGQQSQQGKQKPDQKQSADQPTESAQEDGADGQKPESQKSDQKGKGQSESESDSKADSKDDSKQSAKDGKSDGQSESSKSDSGQDGKAKSDSKSDSGKSGKSKSAKGQKESVKPNGGDAESKSDHSDKSNSKSDSKGGEGKGDQPGEGKQPGENDSNGKPSKSSGKSSKSNSQGTPNGQGQSSGENRGDQSTNDDAGSSEQPTGDEANLEYNRQATELILNRLKKQLDRGEVDEDLLKELGWTPDEMQRFTDRISKSLNESKREAENDLESKARQQQFQEMLKSLDLRKTGTQRSGKAAPKREVEQIDSKRTPPPANYRSATDKFTRGVNRQNPTGGNKPAK